MPTRRQLRVPPTPSVTSFLVPYKVWVWDGKGDRKREGTLIGPCFGPGKL